MRNTGAVARGETANFPSAAGERLQTAPGGTYVTRGKDKREKEGEEVGEGRETSWRSQVRREQAAGDPETSYPLPDAQRFAAITTGKGSDPHRRAVNYRLVIIKNTEHSHLDVSTSAECSSQE